MQHVVRSISEYNYWANAKVVNWLSSLESNILGTKVDSSFGSIVQTVQHINLAQEFWLAFISEGNPKDFDWSMHEQDVREVLDELLSISHNMLLIFCNYSNVELEEQLELDQPWLSNSWPRYEYIYHVINHTTYHRGQIVSIARSLGIEKDIPNTDYLFFKSA